MPIVLLCSLPGVLENVLRPPLGGPGLAIYMTIYNTIWLFTFASVAYGVVSQVVWIEILTYASSQGSRVCQTQSSTVRCWQLRREPSRIRQ